MVLPFGRFQWTRLPMGTVVAQDIFQSKLDAIFIGMEGVTGIADDIVIAGKDEMEHDRNFLAFMEKCMENNLSLNSEKIQFKQTQVSFYGHCWSNISLRVQRLIVRSFPYLPFKVVYKKGKDIPVADALSHVTPMDPEDNIQLPIITVNMITTHILMSVESQDSFSNKLD